MQRFFFLPTTVTNFFSINRGTLRAPLGIDWVCSDYERQNETNSTSIGDATMWNFLNSLLSTSNRPATTKTARTIRKTIKPELFQFEGRLVPTVSGTVTNNHPTGQAHVVTVNHLAPTRAEIVAQVTADATRQSVAVSLSTQFRDNRR
jgi:hypothetical protein